MVYALLFADDYQAEKGDPGAEGWADAGDWEERTSELSQEELLQ